MTTNKIKTVKDLLESGEASDKMKAAVSKNKGVQNLQVFTPEVAREKQKKSLESRMRNQKIRDEKLQLQLEAMQFVSKDITNGKLTAAKGLDIMKYLMMKAMVDEDYKQAAVLASQIAEYEDYKLGRTEAVSYNIDMAKLTEEQLNLFIAGEISETELKVIEHDNK